MTGRGGNIILIGMPGAGKSTLGVLLAKALGMEFVDTDLLIQRRQGQKLQEILDREGMETFLRVEEETILSLRVRVSVVATGGSVVYSPRAMAALGSTGTLVYLQVPAAELKRRLTNITTRGVAMRPGCTLEDVLAERLPLYRQYGQVTVDCAGRDPESCVAELAARLG